MPRLTEQERASLSAARRHYRQALDALPASLRGFSHMGTLTTSFIASIDDQIGTVDDDAAAGWPDPADHWHDGPGVRFEGCGEFAPRHVPGEC